MNMVDTQVRKAEKKLRLFEAKNPGVRDEKFKELFRTKVQANVNAQIRADNKEQAVKKRERLELFTKMTDEEVMNESINENDILKDVDPEPPKLSKTQRRRENQKKKKIAAKQSAKWHQFARLLNYQNEYIMRFIIQSKVISYTSRKAVLNWSSMTKKLIN
jgi:hypothetical protein